jgi:hypothetical protein
MWNFSREKTALFNNKITIYLSLPAERGLHIEPNMGNELNDSSVLMKKNHPFGDEFLNRKINL